VPSAHGLGDGPVANEDCVHRRSQKPFYKRCRAGVSVDEIAEGAEDSAFPKHPAVLEQPRRRWGEPDALSLESLERGGIRARRGLKPVGAEEVRRGKPAAR